MENHPIPQDVTGFKFKLIGSVTLKQFLYILGGGIMALICFVLPVSGLIKFPLSFFFGGLGTALAFIPIEGRPMDVMLKNFLKALPAENQYIFRKKGAEALIFDFFTPPPAAKAAAQAKIQEERPKTDLDTKRALLYKTLKQAHKPDEKEQEALANINSYLHETARPATPPIQNFDTRPTTSPSPVEIVAPSVTIKTAQIEVQPAPGVAAPSPSIAPVGVEPAPAGSFGGMAPAASAAQPVPLPKAPPAVDMPQPSQQVFVATQTVQNIGVPEIIEKPVPQSQSQPAPQPAPQPQQSAPIEPPAPHVEQPAQINPVTESIPLTTTPAASTPTGVAPDESQNVTSVTPEKSLKAGFPQLPDMPNIVMGIIKDPRGKVIPNILVEIMNQQGIPVRAFKTNALGQFAAATPLPDGEYIVTLEDPRKQNEFEQINISLDGSIFDPLEIFSIDQREKLRRELFGNASPAQQSAATA